MIPPRLLEVETELRRAAAQRAYASVAHLLVSLGDAVAEEVRIMPADDPRRDELAAWSRELLDWTGIMLRASRAEQADELRRIPFVQSYLRQQNL